MDFNIVKMSNKDVLIKKMFQRYFKAGDWSEYNKAFFDGIAKKYDATNNFTSWFGKSRLDSKFISRVEVAKNAKILDLCTGTCDIAIKLALKYPNSEIIAFDASDEMLKIGQQKIDKLGIKNIKIQTGDALKMPFEDNYFDNVFISFGLRNLEYTENGIKEIYRVLKRDGKYTNIEHGKPKNPIIKFIYWLYFCNIAPFIGKLLFHIGEFNSFKYLPESNKYFANQDELCEMMKRVGFKNVKNYNYFFGAIGQQVGTR